MKLRVPRLHIVALALVLSLGLAVSACGDDATPTPPPATATSPASTATSPPPTATSPAPTATSAAPTATSAAPTAGPTEVMTKPGEVDFGDIGYGMEGYRIVDFGEPKYGGVSKNSYWTPLRAWDPHGSFTSQSGNFSPMFSNLMQFNPFTFDRFDMWGDLAESWEMTDPSGMEWTFVLKPHAIFSDGSPVTAEDVAYSFDRMLGKTANHPDPLFEASKNLAPHYDRSEAVDASTVKIFLTAPWADFIAFMAEDHFVILPKAHYEELDAKTMAGDDQFTWDQGWKNVIGSGPYRLSAVPSKEEYSYERVPGYWKKDPEGRDLPYLDGMDYFVLAFGDVAYGAWAAEQVWVSVPRANGGMSRPLLTNLLEEGDNKKWIAYRTPGSVTGLVVNPTRAPFDNPIVRRAVFLAMDRHLLNEVIEGNLAIWASTCGPSGHPLCMSAEEVLSLPGYRQLNGEKHPEDVAEARRLMESVGYTASNPAETTYPIREGSLGGTAARDESALYQEMFKPIHLEINVKVVDTATHNELRAKGDFDMLGVGLASASTIVSPDAYLYGTYQVSPNAFGWTYARQEELIKLINEQSAISDFDARKKVLQQIEDITMREDSFWIPSFGRAYSTVFNAEKIAGMMPTQGQVTETKYEAIWLVNP